MQSSLMVLFLTFGTDTDQRIRELDKAVLILEFNSREIEVGEPLFVKTTVLNGGTNAVCFPKRFSSATGLLRFDIMDSSEKWTETFAEGQGGIAFVNSGTCVPSKSSYCAYSVIFSVGGRPLFDKPGQLNLRARVKGEGIELTSVAVPIRVRAARASQYEFLTSTKARLGYLLPEAGGTTIDSIQPIDFDRVPEGRVRSYLEGHRLTVDLVRATRGTRAGALAERRVLEFTKTLDPVMEESYLIALSVWYVNEERYKEALDMLDRLADPSETTVWLRKTIGKKAPHLVADP